MQLAKPLPDYSFAKKYVRPLNAKPAFICDMDGTLMIMGDRLFTDYDKVSLDVPDTRVARLVTILARAGNLPVFLSGRPEKCRADTRQSILAATGLSSFRLLMRNDHLPNGKPDYRQDYIVKYEIFDTHLRTQFDIIAAIDDRLQVVHLWRAMGILCLDVAGGDF